MAALPAARRDRETHSHHHRHRETTKSFAACPIATKSDVTDLAGIRLTEIADDLVGGKGEKYWWVGARR